MKKRLLQITALLSVISALNAGCHKEKSYMGDVVITGFDARACPCCGGLMATVTGETQPYRGEFFLLRNYPSELGISNSSTFPVYLKADWIREEKLCVTPKITITRFRKR